MNDMLAAGTPLKTNSSLSLSHIIMAVVYIPRERLMADGTHLCGYQHNTICRQIWSITTTTASIISVSAQPDASTS